MKWTDLDLVEIMIYMLNATSLRRKAMNHPFQFQIEMNKMNKVNLILQQ